VKIRAVVAAGLAMLAWQPVLPAQPRSAAEERIQAVMKRPEYRH
jgi:hypothetical protein